MRHEVADLAQNATVSCPGGINGEFTVYDILLEYPEKADDLGESLYDPSIGLLECVSEVLDGMKDDSNRDGQISLEIFRRTVVVGDSIELVAKEFGMEYYPRPCERTESRRR